MDIPCFVYPFISWTFELFLIFVYDEKRYYEQLQTSLWVDICFHLSWVDSEK